MKRDMDLVRKLLFYLEENQGTELLLARDIKIDGYEADAIYYNLKIMGEGGLIAGRDMSTQDCRDYIIYYITWEGHEFLDSVRDIGVWNHVMSTLKSVGSLPLDIIKCLALAYLTKKLEID